MSKNLRSLLGVLFAFLMILLSTASVSASASEELFIKSFHGEMTGALSIYKEDNSTVYEFKEYTGNHGEMRMFFYELRNELRNRGVVYSVKTLEKQFKNGKGKIYRQHEIKSVDAPIMRSILEPKEVVMYQTDVEQWKQEYVTEMTSGKKFDLIEEKFDKATGIYTAVMSRKID